LEGALDAGCVVRVAQRQTTHGEVIEHLLKDILQEEARTSITIEQIQRRVAEHFDVRLADMTSNAGRPASRSAAVAMYLARELTQIFAQRNRDAFGGRDHGTVLHACKLVKRRMKNRTAFGRRSRLSTVRCNANCAVRYGCLESENAHA